MERRRGLKGWLLVYGGWMTEGNNSAEENKLGGVSFFFVTRVVHRYR